MSCAKRLLSVFLSVLAFAVLTAFSPSAVLADIVFDGLYYPDSSSWSSSQDGYIGNDGNWGGGTAGAGSVEVTSGTLSSKYGYLGHNTTSSGTATITGADSAWSCNGHLYAGFMGTGVLNVNNGGDVTASYESYSGANLGAIYIGLLPGSSGSVTVSGNNSKLTCPEYLRVGDMGNGTLKINTGGLVTVGSATWVGHDPSGSGMIDFGAGGGTLTTRSLVASPSQLTGTGTINTMGLVSDVALLFDSSNDLTQTVPGFGSVDVKLDMTTGVGCLGVGWNNTTGTLKIQNDVSVNSRVGYVAYKQGSSGTATVDGSGSTWTNSDDLFVGYYGAGRLEITNGGNVYSNHGRIANQYGASPNSAVLVDGSGSTWTMSNDITIGQSANGTLTISSGGVVNNTDGKIAYSSSADSALVTVEGSGSTWNNSGCLYVGYQGFGTLKVENGGAVESDDGQIGSQANSRGVATVDGSGSTWTNTGNLYVGNSSDGDLNITDGGSVTVAGATYVGNKKYFIGTINLNNGTLTTTSLYASPSYSYSTLTGTGRVNAYGLVSDLNLTFDSASSLTQTIMAGGVVINLDMSDSDNVGDLGAGYWGTNKSLMIQNGIAVHSASGCLGYHVDSSGVATVTGSNTIWSCSDNIAVGYKGNGTLNITNGGAVESNGNLYVGMTEDGTGAINFNNGTLTTTSLYASPSHSHSALTGTGTINAYGSVSDLNLTFDSTSSLNQTIAIGDVALNLDMSDSSNVGDLGAGYWGAGNSLTIRNGVAVHSTSGCLGYHVGASGVATVTGSNTIWSCSGSITVGYKGGGTLNIINGGTVVTNAIAALSDYQWGSDSATIVFDSGTLKSYNASNSKWLTDGSWGSGCTVSIQDGGATFDTAGYDMGIDVPLRHGGSGTDGGITKTGAGTLILSGANTYTGVTTVQAGVLELEESAQSVVLTGGGADIQNGKMVFDYVYSYVTSDYEAPDVLTPLKASFTGGTAPWTTGQFQSYTADPEHGLGWVDNGTDQVTVMYTLYGDSNLDGSVNGTDLNAVLSYYNQSGEVWNHGDFNYDGSVNGTDLNTVLSNYNQSLPSSTAAVPEPCTLLLILAAMLSLWGWRKRFMI